VGRFGDPEPLGDGGRLEEFDCGESSLNEWLSRYARAALEEIAEPA